jgi:hypothetical protein
VTTNSSLREMGAVTLAETHDLVNLYAARGSQKFEKAALRWLEHYSQRANRAWSASLRPFRAWRGGLVIGPFLPH